MAAYYIKKVHKSDEDTIEEVKFSRELSESPKGTRKKSRVVDDIDEKGKSVYTAYRDQLRWKLGDEVHTVDGKWIRTDGNGIEADNLGDLPEY